MDELMQGYVSKDAYLYSEICTSSLQCYTGKQSTVFFSDPTSLFRLQCGHLWWHDIYNEHIGRLSAFWSTLWVTVATASLVWPFTTWRSPFLTCHTVLFTCPHRYKSSGVKSLDLGQAIGTPLPIHQTGVCDYGESSPCTILLSFLIIVRALSEPKLRWP